MKPHLKNYFNSRNLLLISPLFLFFIIRYVVGFNGLYGQDSHEYYRYSRALIDFFKSGYSPGEYFFPIYYPVFGAIAGLVIDNLLALQLISFLSLSGTLFFLLKVMANIYGEKNYLPVYLVITFLSAPYILRNSAVIMSDMLSVFFISASFYFFLEYERKVEAKQVLFFSIFSVLAVLTRYASAAVLFVPGVILVYDILKQKKYFRLLVPVFIVSVFLAPMVLINKSIIAELSNHEFLQGWSFSNIIKTDFVTEQGTQSNRFPNIINSFSTIFFPTYLVFGLVLVVLSERNLPKNKYWIISVIIIIIYALFLSGVPFQNQRYLLLSYPFVVTVIYPGFERLVNLLQRKIVLLYTAIFLMLVIQIFFCVYFFRSAIERNKLEREIAGYVRSTDYQTVYAFDIDVSFASYDMNKKVFNLWKEKYSEFRTGSLVIFNEYKFREQWAEKNPMINWNKLKTNYALEELKDFGNGWKAYEIYPVR